MSLPRHRALKTSAAYVSDRLPTEPKDSRTAADLGFREGDRIEGRFMKLPDGGHGFFIKVPNTEDQWMRI